MAFGTNRSYMSRGQAEAAAVDVGLRQYMLRVYNYMASGLALTGIVALMAASSPAAIHAIFMTPLKWVVMFAPLALVFFMGARIDRMQASTAQALFWVYSALMGLSLSFIFIVYTGESVTRVFFITAAAFAGLSLYGYTTRRNLSAFGTFLVMGLVGIMIASIVNMFIQSSQMQFVISAAGVLVFAGLTAWDTQRIKEMYWESDGAEVAAKKAVMGALQLYLDFINLFLFLLQFLGVRRDN
jgi:FtsH-binding integral membrane protein